MDGHSRASANTWAYCQGMADQRAIYAIAAVERMMGESADTIRSWEQRYQLPPPERSPGGQLLYSRDDVERLRWLARELAAGREPEPATTTSTRSPRAPLTAGPATDPGAPG